MSRCNGTASVRPHPPACFRPLAGSVPGARRRRPVAGHVGHQAHRPPRPRQPRTDHHPRRLGVAGPSRPDPGRVRTRLLASRQLRPRTHESYEDQLRLRILPRLGALPLSKITPRHVREWYGALVQQADAAGRGHRAATSSYRVLRAILNTAVQDEILPRNPCALRGASTDRPNDRPMVDEHHVWALADAVPDLYRAVVWLAAGIALRTAELAGLRGTDVDLPNRTLTVRQTYVEPSRGKPYFGPPKSDAGSRTVVLPSVVVPILQEHLDRYSQPGDAGLIFVSEKGQPLSRHNRKWWRLACKDAGLPTGTRLHDLRHAGLTIAAQSGGTLKELMALAGHSSPRAALIYQHAASARAVVVADAVSARLSRPSGSGRADPPA